MSHIWTWMPNCVCSVRPLTPVPHPYNPLLILPCSVGLRPAHSVEQNAGLLISSFRADQWHWWQEPKRRLCTKWGLNKTAFLNDCLGANNPLAEWGHEVGDLGGCSSGGVRLRLRRGGGVESLVSPLVGQLNKQLGTRPDFSVQRHKAPAMAVQFQVRPGKTLDPRQHEDSVLLSSLEKRPPLIRAHSKMNTYPSNWTHTHVQQSMYTFTHTHVDTVSNPLHKKACVYLTFFSK